jgi:hypothetical protein
MTVPLARPASDGDDVRVSRPPIRPQIIAAMAIALLSSIVFVVWRRLDPDDKVNWTDLAVVVIAASVAIAAVVT